MRIVIDSNVWISALVFGGNPRKVFENVVQNGITIVASAELIVEIKRILKAKFPSFQKDFEALFFALNNNMQIVSIDYVKVKVSRDVQDNMVIETALAGNAKYIISGDQDLLVLKAYKRISILSPAMFLTLHAVT